MRESWVSLSNGGDKAIRWLGQQGATHRARLDQDFSFPHDHSEIADRRRISGQIAVSSGPIAE
jgi:hypothetical protein